MRHQTKNSEMPDMRAIKAKAKARFGSVAGVEGFGIGDYVLRIYVSSKATLQNVLPAKFQGVPVDLVITGDISARPR
jgi:hypothetical protein